MPGSAADEGKVPFRTAKEEIRVGFGVEGSEGGGGGREKPGARGRRQDIAWRNVFLMSLLHLGAVYSLALIPKAQPLTLLWAAYGILIHPPGMELAPTALEAQSLNHWTTREVPTLILSNPPWIVKCHQETRVRALVWEDPTCHGAAGPVSHSC
ncbi:stearoyl-CoA desaturase 5-like isoform X1 [Balaenoptera acutorostrata]|uniref:Stearoyl-CoA desaturase 5-like isoform X1 n=1 Tax=Balaenoptera acutorostrata TaxID=9767 RepID=A0ABM3SZM9_BALAC|nr:stearoyl-CoA desaturase 5-like isoform X1 [Balaenoptera acutorostrata]